MVMVVVIVVFGDGGGDDCSGDGSRGKDGGGSNWR